MHRPGPRISLVIVDYLCERILRARCRQRCHDLEFAREDDPRSLPSGRKPRCYSPRLVPCTAPESIGLAGLIRYRRRPTILSFLSRLSNSCPPSANPRVKSATVFCQKTNSRETRIPQHRKSETPLRATLAISQVYVRRNRPRLNSARTFRTPAVESSFDLVNRQAGPG